ncbi:MAG: OmpA family protein [Bacteroidetes bacterium]|nr:OmpA family protein [Bacteroidota bacterium]
MQKILILIAVISISLTSCVSTKKYNDLANRCKSENEKLSAKVDELTTSVNELTSENSRLKKENARLIADTVELASSLRVLTADYDELDRSYEMLKAQTSGNEEETRKVMSQLKAAQDDLIAREDKLKDLQVELDKKAKDLEELRSVLHKKDSITQGLRKAVSDALLGFEGKGLSVHMKDGKVYVSMEEKLLFASGKWEVSNEGVSALKGLAKVLEKNPDINVMIEGHTDNVPYTGTGQVKDNWDLSVMRATSIVKILLANSKIDPKRLTTAGRSEFLPIDPSNNPQSRAKNRRTEIILTPKLDELLQIIGSK